MVEVVKTVSAYDPWITIKKYLTQFGILLLIIALTWVVDSLIPQLNLDYPEYAGIFLILLPLIEALRNWIKHRSDTETIRVDSETGIEINST